jgi:Protein of unknown function (DUF1015)
MAGDRMEELGTCLDVEVCRALLDHAQAEMHVAEQPTFVRLPERRPGRELRDPADVVQQRGREQQVGAQPRMELGRLSTDSRDADRVLEQPARIGVMRLRGREAAERPAHDVVSKEPSDHVTQPGMRDLAGQEFEEAVQLVGVAPECRGEGGRVGVRRGLERAHIDLEPVAELLHPSEHAHRVPLREAGVEQLDVVPDTCIDPPAWIDELECEVGGAVARPEPLLAGDRVNAFDDPLFRQLRDRAHGASLGPEPAARVSPMAEVRPFRAERYDQAAVGPLDPLVAPPYDVISPDERAEYLARSPYNVVHLTLPDDAEQAARTLAEWRRDGVLMREERPSYWLLSQDYVGPDGIARTRSGLVASLRAEPYEHGTVLPHERTHRGPLEGRLRLVRATRTQLEPIFLLYEGEALQPPDREPDLQSGGDRLWRVDDAPDFLSTQLLIADGHHRYETAVAFAEEGGSPYLMVVLVPTRQEGLTIFATHRVAERVNGASGKPIEEPGEELPGVVLYRGGTYELLEGEGLDVDIVEQIGPQGVTYTPRRAEAVATVDRGEAEGAFLLRPTRIEDVWDVARRGETMPQKSTYFYPKLTSGLFFHPLD